ncbi:MAG: GNAT family N-acetyltransferase [Candidatus Limnocylindria bacterium]
MPPGVRRATIADIPAMAATLARAFAHDPYYLLLAGDAPERNQRMRDGWSGILRFGSAKLTDTYTTDDHAGVALWLPPGHGGPSVIDSLRMMPAIGRLSGWRRLRKVSNLTAELETRHRHHMPTPHFYLSALGVEPDRQGEGIGTALMKPVLDRCDRDQVPAYLETATARNVLLYERLGFDVVEELTLPTTDVHGWLMARAARPSTRAQRAPRQAPA